MIDLKALKSLGQNFLIDPKAHERIVQSLKLSTTDTVIEIGPGTGLLTRHLLTTPLQRLVAFELDTRAIPELQREFSAHADRFEVREQDFLTVDVVKLADELGSRLRVVGNIPYYITSPIIFKLIDDRVALRDATLLVQLEVAERLTAEPSTKAYGIPTVLTNFFGEVRFLFKVPAGAFRPIPKVDSAVVHIDFTRPYFARTGTTAPPNFDDVLFRKVVRTSFAMRRKTLRNNVKAAFGPSGVESIEKANLEDLLGLRAEALTIGQFIQLTSALNMNE